MWCGCLVNDYKAESLYRRMLNYTQLMYHLKHNITPVQAFKAYAGHEILQHSPLSIWNPVHTVWKCSRMKLDVRMWLPDYIEKSGISEYAYGSIHTRILYGEATAGILYPKHKMYLHYRLHPHNRTYLHIPTESDWYMKAQSNFTVTLHLYESP